MSRWQADQPDDATAPGHPRIETAGQELLRRLNDLPPSHPSSPAYILPGRTSRERPPDRPGNGWDGPGVAEHPDRPRLEAIRLSPGRRTHILDGDVTGGGHRHGTGKPGKTEFPPDWTDEKITRNILSVAREPGRVHQQWNGRWNASGERDGVGMTVIVNPDATIWTAWPEPGGRGVTQNPREGAP